MVFSSGQIRNVAVLGQGGCGKTTLTEALAVTTGTVLRQGSVAEGTTVSDFDKEEIKRKFSISTSVIPVIWEDTKINLFDTPGYFDFAGEVEEALHAADACIIVISGKNGVEAGTIKAWNYCEKYHLPRMFFVTDMDDDNASFRTVVESLKQLYGKRIAPFHVPIRENETFIGFVNVVKMAARKFTTGSEYEECQIPDYLKDYVSKDRELLMEAIAETSEELLDKYLNGEAFTQIEVSQALRANVCEGTIIPVLMGSGLFAQGTTMLLKAIEKYFPSADKQVFQGKMSSDGDEVTISCDENGPVSLQVFKTIADPFIGKYSVFKVCTGVLKTDTPLVNKSKDMEEKFNKLYTLCGKTQTETGELHAGDIGAFAKLVKTQTGDTLAQKEFKAIYNPVPLSTPYTYVRYAAKNPGEDEKVAMAFAKLLEEDKTLQLVNDAANRQSLLYGMGEQHIELAVSKLLSRYKAEVKTGTPRIPYKETIRKKEKVQSRYKKQSGGHGQFADVVMEFEPTFDWDTPYVFEEKIFGGSVPKNYFPAVEKGIAECVKKGPLAGFPVVGVKAVLVDGSYHPVDSSELAFKTASIQAFKEAFLKADPVFLEPMVMLTVIVPDKFTGDVMADLNKRHGMIGKMNASKDGTTEIVSEISLEEMTGYCTKLRSMTGGYGDYHYEFSKYSVARAEVQSKIIKKYSEDEKDW